MFGNKQRIYSPDKFDARFDGETFEYVEMVDKEKIDEEELESIAKDTKEIMNDLGFYVDIRSNEDFVMINLRAEVGYRDAIVHLVGELTFIALSMGYSVSEIKQSIDKTINEITGTKIVTGEKDE